MNPCRAIVIANIRHGTIFVLIVTYLKIMWSVDEDLITCQQKMYTAREICQHNLYTSNINEKESYIQYCIILCNICNIGNFIMQYFQYLVQKVAFRTKKKICHTCPLSYKFGKFFSGKAKLEAILLVGGGRLGGWPAG